MKRKESVTFWAWTVSVAVHLIVFTAFGLFGFSRSSADSKLPAIPMAKVSRVKKLIETESLIIKPKIKRTFENKSVAWPKRKTKVNRIFEGLKPSGRTTSFCLSELTRASDSTNNFSLRGQILPGSIEFFGSTTEGRKVCFVVDCSGSMQGMFGMVRRKLKDSVQALQPDQFFYVILFGNDKIFESGNGRLVRATPLTKLKACDFIDSIQPTGQTNAVNALKRALQICDSRAGNVSVLYFLTDGFELTGEQTKQLTQTIANLSKRFAPTAKINTIGFWPQENDRILLETIARQSGGEFISIIDDSD